MKTHLVALLLSAPAIVAAQTTEPPRADYWIRASVSDKAFTSDGPAFAAAAASVNMAFGSMVNEIRQTWVGESQKESAILVGLRRVESHRSLSLAVGLGIASHDDHTYSSDYRRTFTGHSGPYPGLALELHGTGFIKSWVGAGAGLIANVNGKRSFCAVIMSLDIGTMRDPHQR